MKQLEFFEKPTLSGQKPKKLIIFLHGYGSSGDDLIGLASDFRVSLPDAHFISPNAPFDFVNTFVPVMGGYKWFSLESYDPQIIYPQILEANEILDHFVDGQLKRFNLDYSDISLVGFSQGSMMAMYNSLRRKNKINSVISYSGRLILPTMLGEKINSKPQICLIHGKEDDVLPFDHFLEAEKILKQEQIPFDSHPLDHLGHSIDLRGIKIAKEFLKTTIKQ